MNVHEVHELCEMVSRLYPFLISVSRLDVFTRCRWTIYDFTCCMTLDAVEAVSAISDTFNSDNTYLAGWIQFNTSRERKEKIRWFFNVGPCCFFIFQELLSKTTLETQKIDLMAEVSDLKIKLASAEAETKEYEDKLWLVQVGQFRNFILTWSYFFQWVE